MIDIRSYSEVITFRVFLWNTYETTNEMIVFGQDFIYNFHLNLSTVGKAYREMP